MAEDGRGVFMKRIFFIFFFMVLFTCKYVRDKMVCVYVSETVIFEDLKREFTTAGGASFYFRTVLFFTESVEEGKQSRDACTD